MNGFKQAYMHSMRYLLGMSLLALFSLNAMALQTNSSVSKDAEIKSLKFLRFPAATLIDQNFAATVLRYAGQRESVALPKRIQWADEAYDKQRFAQALRHYEQAAFYGDKFSQFRLGEIYVTGSGEITKNTPLGMAWLALAAESASLPKAAYKYTQNIWQQMTHQQKLQAQQKLDELALQYSNISLLARLDKFYKRRLGNRTGTRLLNTKSRLNSLGK